MELRQLKLSYNKILKRYNNMTKWCETASIEEQEKNYKHMINVIKDCRQTLNEIKKLDPLVTPGEILNGFK